jgi:hypothetical protein
MAGRGILQVNGEAFKNLWSFEIRLLQVIGTVVVFYTGCRPRQYWCRPMLAALVGANRHSERE